MDTKSTSNKATQGKPKTARKKAPATIDALAAPAKESRARRPKSEPTRAAEPAGETKIMADIDAGFGNAVYIRGDGAGLSWEKGTPLECLDHRTWVWSTKSATEPFSFKLLLNDSQWASGDNMIATPGKTVWACPTF